MIYAFEYPTYFQVCITDGTAENSYTYQYLKDQDLEVSIAESVLLANFETDKRKAVPVSV